MIIQILAPTITYLEMCIDDVLGSLKDISKEWFLIAEEIGSESSFLLWVKHRTCWSMTITNSPKDVSLPQIYFEHRQLTRINYIEIICHIYLRVLFLCGLWGESLISILIGALCGFDDPQTMQTSDDSTFISVHFLHSQKDSVCEF